MTEPARRGQLQTIEAGRGIAAVLVVLFHASAAIFPAEKYWHTTVFGGAFNWGYAGVFFFFVLSGFIIVQVHAGDLGRPERLARYLSRRLKRIYPVYWIVLGGVIGLAALGIGALPSPSLLASSILLVGPDNRDTVLAVAWTLYHEIAFYAVFAAWIASRWLGAALTLAWLALIGGAAVVSTAPVPAYLGMTVNLLFGFGVVAWWLSQRVLPAPGLLAALGAAAFVAIGYETVVLRVLAEWARELAFGAAATIGLAGAVALERRRRVAVPRLLLALGAASYSIYLTHFPLLSLLAKIGSLTAVRTERIPPEIAFIVVVTATVVLGYAFHRIVERPLLARLGRG